MYLYKYLFFFSTIILKVICIYGKIISSYTFIGIELINWGEIDEQDIKTKSTKTFDN